MKKNKMAVVLLSGGLDSSTCLYWAKRRGYRPLALLFDYGQRHKKEMESAKHIAKECGLPFRIIRFKLPWGGSALLDRGGALPEKRSPEKMLASGIPASYVPARNTIFLSFALSYADAVGAEAAVIGANAVDYSGYPDCRPRYLRAMEKAARLGTRRGSQGKRVDILAPLLRLSKKEIVHLGKRLGVPFELTWSCYRGGRKPCGLCDSCVLRRKGFREAGIRDPLEIV